MLWYPCIREGQQSHKIEKCAGTPALERANRAIKLKNVPVPPCYILLRGSPIITLSPSVKALSSHKNFQKTNSRKTSAYCSQTIAYY